jgi:hypothetical protein
MVEIQCFHNNLSRYKSLDSPTNYNLNFIMSSFLNRKNKEDSAMDRRNFYFLVSKLLRYICLM